MYDYLCKILATGCLIAFVSGSGSNMFYFSFHMSTSVLTQHPLCVSGTSEGQVYESEDQEEHQFSDIEDSEDEDDEDNEEEEEELSSHEDAPSSCSTDTHQSDSGPGSQTDPTGLTGSEREEREKQLSPVKPWRSGQAISPDSKRALFSSKAWDHSLRAFSPAREGSPLQSVSPRLELSSPCRHLSPSPERCPSPLTVSPLRSFSPLRPLSPAHYRSSRARLSPTPFRTQHRAHSSPGHFHWEPSTKSRESQQVSLMNTS